MNIKLCYHDHFFDILGDAKPGESQGIQRGLRWGHQLAEALGQVGTDSKKPSI